MFTPNALDRGSYMIIMPHFLDEVIEKSMDYSPESLKWHKLLV